MRSRSLTAAALVLSVLAALPLQAAEGEARLIRYPHVVGERVAFVYAGDIWTVPASGGRARRVTSLAEGIEVFPRISPDGEWIAFSGEYAGTRQVYVVPYGGGTPKRLTFYPDVGRMPPRGGYDYMVLDWTPDGSRILVRANRTPFGRRVGKYILVDPGSPGLEEELQIPEGGPATFSPDGSSLAYNIKSREFRTWKRYDAGRAQDVFIYDLEADECRRVTDFEGTDNFPMWIGSSIYFTSDRGENRKLNLWRYGTVTGDIERITAFEEFDVLWPARGGDRIAFENGGYLYMHDTATGGTAKIDVILGSDKPFARPVYQKVSGNIGSWTISPSGARAAFGARGDVFTVPAEHGPVRNVTRTPGIREREVEWSPAGDRIACLSERSGEYELWLIDQAGSEEARQVTEGSDSWLMGPVWAPGGDRIALADKKNRLWIVDVESGGKRLADRSTFGGISDYSFSPDGRWVCYTKTDGNRMNSIWVYSLDSGEPMRLTGGFTNEREPVFSTDGELIYFVSSRDFMYSERDWRDRIYVGTLLEETKNPVEPLSDEEKPSDKGEEDDGKEKEGEDGVKIERVDSEGFDDRVMSLPLPARDRYYGLTAVDGGVAFIEVGDGGERELKRFDLAKREAKSVTKDVRAYRVSADGKKFIYTPGDGVYTIAPFTPGRDDGGKLDLSEMEMRIDPPVEWAQIYHDAWRIMRDWFYDPGMHGVDWKAMHDRYAVLVPHVAHRTDLDYVLGELIGELNAGHTYVFEGTMPSVERVPVGMLGCELEADGGRWRISKIYEGSNWHGDERSPLTEPGLGVSEGMYLLEIDGSDLDSRTSPFVYLENRAGEPVEIVVADSPDGDDSKRITIRPIDSELKLYYMDWVEENRRLVDELSGGRIGYMHIPNTWYDGYRAFFEAFQPLMDKDALIIDERYNGGGHSPYEMVEIMSRVPFSYWSARHTELFPTPFPFHEGPKAMLINGLSSSGGDAFPFYFRKAGLGPLIGEKTWGGLIGYGYSPRFVDGGGFAVPGFAFVNTEGEWDVEAVGVEPDIHVWDDPALIQAGREPMIERAVEYLLEELEKKPPREIKTPQGPDRSR